MFKLLGMKEDARTLPAAAQEETVNISIVQPNYSFENNSWLPYSVACVYTYAKSKFHFINLNQVIFRRQKINLIIDNFRHDSIVMFSNYMWNWNYNCKLAKEIKTRFPHVKIVFGGPQVSETHTDRQANEHSYVDSWIVGEGELSFCDFLLDLHNNTIKRIYSLKTRMPSLDIPSPYLTGIFDKLIQENPDFTWNTTIETNRGCPFRCTFCDWGSLTYSKVKKFDLSKVQSELEWLGKNKVTYVFVADANFGIFKDRDAQIVEMMKALQTKFNYPKVYNCQWYKNSKQDVAKLAKRLTQDSLNRGLTMSVQSMSEDVLDEIKRKNMDVSHLESMFESIQEQDLNSYTELILPLPKETFDSWKRGFEKILDIGQHNSIEVWLHQLLQNASGAQIEARKLHQFKTVMLPDYCIGDLPKSDEENLSEYTEIVISTKDMPFEDFVKSWMYSAMIVNFHSGGWTQLLARYNKYALGGSYYEFYEKLFSCLYSDMGKIGEIWRSLENYLIILLKEKDYQGVAPHSSISNLNKQLHAHSKDAFNFILNVFCDFPMDLLSVQTDIIYCLGKPDKMTVSLHTNYFDYLAGFKDNPKKGQFFYTLKTPLVATPETHYENLYYKRRIGYGKYKISSVYSKARESMGTSSVPRTVETASRN